MAQDRRLLAYQKAMNKLDDYFEYRCQSHKDKLVVQEILTECNKEIVAWSVSQPISNVSR